MASPLWLQITSFVVAIYIYSFAKHLSVTVEMSTVILQLAEETCFPFFRNKDNILKIH